MSEFGLRRRDERSWQSPDGVYVVFATDGYGPNGGRVRRFDLCQAFGILAGAVTWEYIESYRRLRDAREAIGRLQRTGRV